MKKIKGSEKGRVRRRGMRIPWVRPLLLLKENGEVVLGHTIKLSLGGLSARINRPVEGGNIFLFVCINACWHALKGRVAFCERKKQMFCSTCFETGIAFDDKNAGSWLWELSRNVRDTNASKVRGNRFFRTT